jgi:hypothetical protein
MFKGFFKRKETSTAISIAEELNERDRKEGKEMREKREAEAKKQMPVACICGKLAVKNIECVMNERDEWIYKGLCEKCSEKMHKSKWRSGAYHFA